MLLDKASPLSHAPSRERLRTPQRHLELLIEPSPAELRRWLGAPPADWRPNVSILDSSAAELGAALVRRLDLARPLVVTGHQVEFFHAGVLAKTVATALLPSAAAGRGLFVWVDSDLPKAAALSFPALCDNEFRHVKVPLPACAAGLPIESQPALPRERWLAFFDELARRLPDADQTLLAQLRAALAAGSAGRVSITDLAEAAQRVALDALGLPPVATVTVSRLMSGPELRAFAAHLLLHARRFAECYNAAQAAYRARHRLRNPQRPAPPLRVEVRRVETPFWVYRAGRSRRRLFVADRGEVLELLADERPIGRLNVGQAAEVAFHRQPWPVEQAGWRIRPRALALSAALRLLLADVFIHGIGGAKYDEMTDDFLLRFWGRDAAPYACVSATLLPAGAVDESADEQLRELRRVRRDLHYNPQRHLAGLPPDLLTRRDELIRQSESLRRQRPHDRAARRRVFEELRRTNHELLHADPLQAADLERGWHALEQRCRQQMLLRDREVFFALHRRSELATLVSRLREQLDSSGN